MGRPAGWMKELTGRSPMKSPGAPSLRREVEREFWILIARGLTSEDAGIAVGASQAVGSRWFREGGGMSPFEFGRLSGRYLPVAERPTGHDEPPTLPKGGAGAPKLREYRRVAHSDRISWRREAYAIDGAGEALARATERHDVEGFAREAAHTALWITALDNELRDRQGAGTWEQARRTAEVHDLLLGLRYVRNQAVHALVLFGEQMGEPVPLSIMEPLPSLPLWLAVGLPEGDHANLLAAYSDVHAGRPVLPSLERAINWLQAQALAGPGAPVRFPSR